jgi:hypothetical protein
MSDAARAMSTDDALQELRQLEADGLILLEGAASAERVSLDGWDPVAQEKQDGNVAGVVVRFLSSGSATGSPAGGNAPDRLDPRNALAIVRLCQWLNTNHGATELYHLGMTVEVDNNGNPRTDCHGQGRAVDFVGVKTVAEDGTEIIRTVFDDWGTARTSLTPDGNWPAGTGSAVSYRLDAPDAENSDARDFFRAVYEFIASQWQDRTTTADPADTPTAIGERSFIMHPDHPSTAPGKPNGREAHRNHIHMQIGVTGTA